MDDIPGTAGFIDADVSGTGRIVDVLREALDRISRENSDRGQQSAINSAGCCVERAAGGNGNDHRLMDMLHNFGVEDDPPFLHGSHSHGLVGMRQERTHGRGLG